MKEEEKIHFVGRMPQRSLQQRDGVTAEKLIKPLFKAVIEQVLQQRSIIILMMTSEAAASVAIAKATKQ